MMEVVRLVEAKVLLLAEEILKVLENGSDYLTFEVKLKQELDGLGRDLLKTLMEALDEKFRESEERKRNWTIVRKNDPKEILTPFGRLIYQRTYYRNKESKEYSYLVDEKVGINPHVRVGVSLKAELTEACTGISYEGATQQVSRHNPELKVSKQTVAKCVKEFKAKELPEAEKKRCVPVLYVEADEDHIKVKGRSGAQARLIYVHEGIEEQPRRRLINPRYFTTVNKKPEQFWLEVCDYIAAHYDLKSVKLIYLSGDGGKWIRVGQEYIPGAIFILDKFHLAKYILTATAHAPDLKSPIYRGIRLLDKEAVMSNLQEALICAQERPRQERVLDTLKYIMNNWDGIESSIKHPHVGCSAEAHVSHILAARLSSRPMAWSTRGAEKMASMRAVRANGESVNEHYLAMKPQSPVIVELKKEVKKELKRIHRKREDYENLNNVPLFQSGNSFTRTVLRKLNEKMIV